MTYRSEQVGRCIVAAALVETVPIDVPDVKVFLSDASAYAFTINGPFRRIVANGIPSSVRYPFASMLPKQSRQVTPERCLCLGYERTDVRRVTYGNIPQRYLGAWT